VIFSVYEAGTLIVLFGWIVAGRKEEWDGLELLGAVFMAALWPALVLAYLLALLIAADVRK
jgi:hypothetical protein